jgi:hypothetical protein
MAERFRPVNAPRGRRPSDVANRRAHATQVLNELQVLRPDDARPGVYIQLEGRPGEPIDADKFDKSGLRLLSIEQSTRADHAGELVFFAPTEALETFERKVIAFRDEETQTGRPKNADLVQSIQRLRPARLKAMWRGPAAAFPQDRNTPCDWEVWLKTDAVDAFVADAVNALLDVAPDRLVFPEQTIIQVTASRNELAGIVRESDGVMALAKPATTAEFFDGMPVEEQADWTENFAERVQLANPPRTWITLLDTGVTRAHPLIAPALAADDRHAANPAWAVEDLDGHGSGMAGLALYGDLTSRLQEVGPFHVAHRLESVKVIPDAGENPYHLLGAVTRQAVDAVEAEDGARRRVFTLATSTSDDHPHDGAPTSWSTEVDQLAAGASGQVRGGRRLIVTSAGNVKTTQHMTARYHAVCDHASEELEAPGQAWNAITVGACTHKVTLGQGMAGRPLAPAGDLSPHSKTSSWSSTWPIKPDLVLEGGNLVLDQFPPAMAATDLSLLTTHHDLGERHFSTFEATSAAAALAARMAAQVWSAYPDYWPETIRALLVSSGRWTPAMLRHLPPQPGKGDYDALFRRYGYGVPNLARARRSAKDAVTLIAQGVITPYTHSATRGAAAVHNEIRLHALPWPRETLRRLRGRDVTLRVALSTFVEPNPAEAARGRKLGYGSHGLRFKLKRADETEGQFRLRINKAAATDDEPLVRAGVVDDDGWRFGQRRRDVGSLHVDELTCPASDLARRDILGVHPVGGWWKTKLRPDAEGLPQARYALVVDIDADGAEVDLYAEAQVEIAAQIAAQAKVEI